MNVQEKFSDEKERKVFLALASPELDFRTVEGIAADTQLPGPQVLEILEKYPELVRRSYVPDERGRDLYTLQERRVKLQERLAFLRALLAKSFR
jgi:hypothetical protein